MNQSKVFAMAMIIEIMAFQSCTSENVKISDDMDLRDYFPSGEVGTKYISYFSGPDNKRETKTVLNRANNCVTMNIVLSTNTKMDTAHTETICASKSAMYRKGEEDTPLVKLQHEPYDTKPFSKFAQERMSCSLHSISEADSTIGVECKEKDIVSLITYEKSKGIISMKMFKDGYGTLEKVILKEVILPRDSKK